MLLFSKTQKQDEAIFIVCIITYMYSTFKLLYRSVECNYKKVATIIECDL